MIEIELILCFILVGVGFVAYRLTKLSEAANKIIEELKLSRNTRRVPRRIIKEEPLPPPLRLSKADIDEASSYKP
jgi:hypothetical protein